MERQRVSSSNLRSVGYDAASSTLEVEFNSGGVYQYFNVPEAAYSALMRASSKGSYVNDNIKDRYRCRKVR
ncbi:MAG: KTSC domain-containing protein [Verrucomicrobiota bacterium]